MMNVHPVVTTTVTQTLHAQIQLAVLHVLVILDTLEMEQLAQVLYSQLDVAIKI